VFLLTLDLGSFTFTPSIRLCASWGAECGFILIILGLFQALGSFFTEGWLLILQSPGKLIQKVFNVGSKSISNLGGVTVNSLVSKNPGLNNNSALQVRGVESNSLDSQERLANILGRLEAIRQEQSQLLEEVSAILSK
jgi:hypothetical protein